MTFFLILVRLIHRMIWFHLLYSWLYEARVDRRTKECFIASIQLFFIKVVKLFVKRSDLFIYLNLLSQICILKLSFLLLYSLQNADGHLLWLTGWQFKSKLVSCISFSEMFMFKNIIVVINKVLHPLYKFIFGIWIDLSSLCCFYCLLLLFH